MIKGSCYCGAVKYEIHGRLLMFAHCASHYPQGIPLSVSIESHTFQGEPDQPVQPHHIFDMKEGQPVAHYILHPMRLHMEPMCQVGAPYSLLNVAI